MNDALFAARRPQLLDVFCGAGGAAWGYHLAGFEVVGIDHRPQPNYPFQFIQCDGLRAIEYVIEMKAGYDSIDAIHASPPCQAHTSMQSVAKNADAHHDLIGPVRERLQQTGVPYVIENVVGAPLDDPFTLCASYFGLGVTRPDTGEWYDLRRHRLFETSWPVGLTPPCSHSGVGTVGIYGDHLRWGRRSSQGELSGPAALFVARDAMGIDWMTWPEIVQAIPPAYTAWVAESLLSELDARRWAA